MESSLKIVAVYSDDNQHRTLLRKTWGGGKSCTVIMLYPSSVEVETSDLTTLLVMNGLHKLKFESVDIVNIFSGINPI